MTKAELKFLGCTIVQQAKDGKIVYSDGDKFRVLGGGEVEKPEGEVFYIHTPIHGPAIDGLVARPSDVPGNAGWWFQSYMNGNLLSGNGWEEGDPRLPSYEGSPQFKVLQQFIAADNSASE